MNLNKNKLEIIFLLLILAWYFLTFFISYTTLANSLGSVALGFGHSWPVSFFLMDTVVIGLTLYCVGRVIKELKKKKRTHYWLLFLVLLVYPLTTVWATLQDLIFSPIAP